jgi:DNA repair/transcription protein MET18/MMS19
LIPQMMNAYDSAEESSARSGVLLALALVLEARRKAGLTLSADQTSDPLWTHKDALLSRLASSLQSPPLASSSLSCLHQFVQLPLLTRDELSYVVHNLTEALIKARTAEEDPSTEIIGVLETISNLSSNLVEEITLQTLFALLPEDPPTKTDDELQDISIHVLSVFESLCLQPDLFSWLIARLSSKIELLVGRQYTGPGNTEGEHDTKAAISFAHAMFSTIFNTLDKKVERNDLDISKYIDRFVPRLYYLFFDAALVQNNPLGSDATLIDDAAKIIPLIVASLSHE